MKELAEKLGRNDLCPCASGKRFKKCCLKNGCF
jgi:preprotein translocase subunit SecA